MSFRLSETSRQRLEGVDPRLIKIAERAIQISVVDFGIPQFGGVRAAEEQNRLYLEGVSNADGYTVTSFHQPAEDGLGKAIDFFAYINGRASWDDSHMAFIGAAFLQAANELGYKIEWGGLWKEFKDTPHIQFVG